MAESWPVLDAHGACNQHRRHQSLLLPVRGAADMDAWASFMGRNGFLPHGFCLQWSPGVLWTMVGSDALIALAYFSIPLAILSFIRRRGGAPQGYGPLPWLFSGFIFACGLTHVLDIWTLWRPDYGLLALSKALTAGVSTATALALWPLIPRALKIPSVQQLQAAIASLEAEVARRRTAEEHLQDSERSLAVTLASIDAGFLATDAEGRVTRLNAVAERITGWTQAQAQGQLLWDVLDREDRPAGWLQRNPLDVAEELNTDIAWVQEIRVRSRSGAVRLVEVRAAVTHAETIEGSEGREASEGSQSELGPRRGLVAVFRDITRLREAEAELPRLAAIVESSEDAIIGKTLQGRITSWNRAAQLMFGYTAAEALGQPVQMLFPPGTEHQEMAFLAALAAGQRVLPFHTERVAKDGTRVHVLVTISPIRDAGGRIVGASKIARDVSHLRRAEAALRESQARLDFALNAGQIGDWDFDLDSGSTRRSIRHDRCFGYSELLPAWNFDLWTQHLHPDDRAAVVARFQAAMAERRDWFDEYRVVWPDGSVHWISAHGSVYAPEGQPPRVLGIVMDITRHKRAEEARLTAQRLEAENRQIQESSRLKSQFLANMSHELRTPLNAIIGFADLLKAGSVPEGHPQREVFLGHIASSGRHLLQLINDVLDLSKVESGKFDFQPEDVDLPALVADVCAVLHGGLQGKRLRLAIDIAPDLGPLRLDPGRLKQALYNYLSNAIKFTPEGGQVWVRARAAGPAHFRLEVQDSGIGIAPADLPRLFVEFQQLDSGYSKQHQGTGLGLALTRRLIQAQGGSVGVRSQPGVGSVFHLLLPCQPQPAGHTPPAQLLLVDEDGPYRSQLAGALREAGCMVDTAADSAQALRQARARSYDAITLGLQLPDGPGLAVLDGLRQQPGDNQATPVRGLSMAVGPQASAAFAVADVLAKPPRSGEVLQALAACGLPAQAGRRVMVIDDDPLALSLMHHTLQAGGFEDRGWTDGRMALHDLPLWRPDAIVLDLMMPGFDGFAVLDALDQQPDWRHVPVLVWTSLLLTDDELDQLAQSARAVLAKGGGLGAVLVERLRLWRRTAEQA